MTDTELIQAMRSREAELTTERNNCVQDGTKRTSERWDLLNACVVFLSLAADRVSEL